MIARILLIAGLIVLSACGVDRRVERADRAREAGDYAAAEAGYRWVLEREPDRVEALYGLGWIYLQGGDPMRARDYFKRCVRVAPGDYRGHKGLGSVALSQNLLTQAETSFQDALSRTQTPEERASVLNSLALVDSTAGREDQALAHLEEAVSLAPDRGELRLNLAELKHRAGLEDQALAEIDAGLSLNIEELRFRGQLLVLRAQVLVSMTIDRLNTADCEGTLGPVLAYLERADRALDQAEALGVELPSLYVLRRRVHQRRSIVTERCPE